MKQVVEPSRSTCPSPDAGDGPSRLSVVIADDTADVRALLCYTLDLDGRFEVVGEAGDGVEAVRSVEAEQPDAVVLDLAMPVMDGLRAIPLIADRSPGTRIVVLSGFNSSPLARDAMARGAHAYVEKGATFNKLTTVLADVCAAGRRPAPASFRTAPPKTAPPRPTPTGEVVGKPDTARVVDPRRPRRPGPRPERTPPAGLHVVPRVAETARAAETTIRRARWAGVAFAVLQFALYQPRSGVRLPYPRLPAGTAVVLALVLLNVVSQWAARRKDDRVLLRTGRLVQALDTLIVLAVVWLFASDASSALWLLLVLPVLEGAVRHGYRGGAATWAAVAAGYVTEQAWAARHFGDPAHSFSPEMVAYHLGVVLLVALTCARLARTVAEQRVRHAWARAEAEHRAHLLALVAAATSAMASLDADELLDAVVETCMALGFEGAELCVYDAATATWLRTRQLGVPASEGEDSQPVDTGLAGTVWRCRESVLVGEEGPESPDERLVTGFRSMVAMPIWSGDVLGAALVAGRTRERPIGREEIESLQLLASQAGVGLANVNLVDQIRHQALHDPLTGLPNQLLFEDRVRQSLTQAGRSGERLAVMFLDLDRFKQVNDSLGHDLGNELLKQVAGRLLSVVRRGDTVARLGGDEFTLLVHGVYRVEDVTTLAAKIGDAFTAAFTFDHQDLVVKPSIGIALYPSDGLRYDTLLKHADVAMYRVKSRGGNGFALYEDPADGAAGPRAALEADIPGALDRGELSVVYQPVIDLRTDRVAAVEALACWHHRSLGIVGPVDFVPLAEEAGVMVAIDRWVLRTACRQLQDWHEQGLPPLRLTVNVSGRNLAQPGMAPTVVETLRHAGVAPARLELEITESVAVAETERTHAALDTLHRRGVRVAIDDFGTGSSMLTWLREMPLDTLKIDRSFVHEISRPDDDTRMVAATIAMAHGLGLDVVAVGVETSAQLAVLRRHGCDLVQGYLFSRPMEADDVTRLLVGQATHPLGALGFD